MKLVEMKCKNCGAQLKVENDATEVTCKFCGANYKLDDGKIRIDTENFHEAGYQLEKGKLKAQMEAEEERKNKIIEKEKKDKALVWWVLGWIFFFPIPLTILIYRSTKLSKKAKIALIIALWVVIILIGVSGNDEDKEQMKNKIITCYSEETYNKLDELVGIENISGNFDKDEACKNMNLRNSKYDKIVIEMDDNKNLISITLDGEYIYQVETNNETSE